MGYEPIRRGQLSVVEGSNLLKCTLVGTEAFLHPNSQRLIGRKAYPWSVHGAQFKNWATAFAQIDNLRDDFKMRTQIGNLQNLIALCNLQNVQIGKCAEHIYFKLKLDLLSLHCVIPYCIHLYIYMYMHT